MTGGVWLGTNAWRNQQARSCWLLERRHRLRLAFAGSALLTIAAVAHTRRTFLGGVASLAASSIAVRTVGAHDSGMTSAAQTPNASPASSTAKRGIKLGLDHFGIRAFGWKAGQLIDYAASQQLDGIFLSELNVLESRDDAYLKGLRAQAEKAGLTVYLGMNSVCPSSAAFDAKAGSAEDQLKDGIRMAKTIGSPVIRCYLGTQADRSTQGGIETHMKNLIEVFKTVRPAAQQAGIRISVENHAGDMQAWELASLVEAAGPDVVGVNINPGNAAWTLEDPVRASRSWRPTSTAPASATPRSGKRMAASSSSGSRWAMATSTTRSGPTSSPRR